MKKVRILNQYRDAVLIVFILSFLLNLFSDNPTSSVATSIFIGFWILVINLYKSSYKTSLLLAILFTIFAATATTLEGLLYADKLALWVYIFLITGLIQQIWKSKNETQS